MQQEKRRFGDRRDAKWLREIDSMHAIMPYIMPNRADNETFLNIKIDLTNALAFLAQRNEGRTEDKYTLFHLIASALVKAVTLRPKMNRFYKGARIYQRNKLTLAFVVKKKFADESHEALAFKSFGPETTIDTLHETLMKEIHQCRREDMQDKSTDAMDFFMKFPRWILRPTFYILRRLDYYGKVPKGLIASDPYYSSILISNLGSIGLDAAYHHLNNWGTNSIFATIGKMREETLVDAEGAPHTRTVLNIGLTLDERIADGYYYSQTVKLLRKLLEEPQLLETPANQEVKI